ncbi:MAG: hypothetical protein EZS28_022065 [Streblomastix strix]|uniref:Uncharacterized protein n=1 Tax=Streblomastix strix TaxID=222440 RepID=A0A5J4VII5_9EUKA|nr:MAG: hypothetical protein EZS28_022065 [Streblomastix strix]
MLRRTYQTCKHPPSRDSCQTLNYTNLVTLNLLHSAAQLQSTFVNAIRLNIEIDLLDTDQIQTAPKEVPSNANSAIWALQAGLSGQEMSQISFVAEEPSEEQVVQARQRARAVMGQVTRRKPPKHNNPPAQPMLAFEQIISDLETKQQQQYRLLQRTLTLIAKRDLLVSLKFNLCTFIIKYDTVYKLNMT